jgi:molecular chaperone DnaK
MQIELLRSKFEQMIEPVVKKTLTPVKNALKDAGLKTSDVDEIILVGGSTRIPAVREAVEKFFGKKLNSSVNPDEVVALGAAVQGGVFSGDVTDVLLLDVTPLSLGIETLGGVMTRLIDRNSTIPCSKSETFSTAADGQSSVDIHVLQGERQFSKDNRLLGNFRLDGLPPAPRGVPQIEVTFDIDANGIVNVSAKDTATGKEQSIRIEGDGSLSDEEIKQMVDDAKLHEEEDNLRKTEIENRNKCDNAIYLAEKTINDNDIISDELKEEVREAIKEARSALESGDNDQITISLDKLNTITQKVGEDMYKATSHSNQPDDSDDPTTSAEYEEAI